MILARYEFRVVEIARIDPPPRPMRESMSDEGLASLVASIRALGLLHPLGVVVAGARYRVAYGHRRRVALEIGGWREAPCFVYPAGTSDEEALLVAENDQREDVNVAAQATYYRYLFDHVCGQDIYRLCERTGKTESWLQGRLALTEGDPDVLAALRADVITLGVATELNRVNSDTYRRLFLADAQTQGLSVAAVRVLRQNVERQEALAASRAAGEHVHVPASTEAPLASADQCVLCDSAEDTHDMEYRRVHRSCLAVLARKARAAVARDQA